MTKKILNKLNEKSFFLFAKRWREKSVKHKNVEFSHTHPVAPHPILHYYILTVYSVHCTLYTTGLHCDFMLFMNEDKIQQF